LDKLREMEDELMRACQPGAAPVNATSVAALQRDIEKQRALAEAAIRGDPRTSADPSGPSAAHRAAMVAALRQMEAETAMLRVAAGRPAPGLDKRAWTDDFLANAAYEHLDDVEARDFLEAVRAKKISLGVLRAVQAELLMAREAPEQHKDSGWAERLFAERSGWAFILQLALMKPGLVLPPP